jgi:hypothetical protein
VAALGGLLILLAGGLALIGGRSWPGPTRRYERAGPSGAAGTPPTATSKRPATASPVAEARADTPADVWDALSRGEDPTSAPESPT